MEPRELDALVAQKVMGLVVETVEEFDTWEYTLAKKSGHIKLMTKDQQKARFWRTVKRISGKPVPFYSTDIAAAWQVVERLKSLKFGVGVKTWGAGPLSGDYAEVQYWERMDSENMETYTAKNDSVMADTVPLAICLGALRALGIPEGGE